MIDISNLLKSHEVTPIKPYAGVVTIERANKIMEALQIDSDDQKLVQNLIKHIFSYNEECIGARNPERDKKLYTELYNYLGYLFDTAEHDKEKGLIIFSQFASASKTCITGEYDALIILFNKYCLDKIILTEQEIKLPGKIAALLQKYKFSLVDEILISLIAEGDYLDMPDLETHIKHFICEKMYNDNLIDKVGILLDDPWNKQAGEYDEEFYLKFIKLWKQSFNLAEFCNTLSNVKSSCFGIILMII